jgi:flagellar hook-associated protein 3 FlgL
MSTRITTGMISRGVLTDLNEVANRLTQTQRKMSSGKELTRPSDDPFAVGRALGLRTDLEGIGQYRRNTDEASGWSSATDTALGTIGNIAQRARELLVRGASDTSPPSAREAIAQEIDQLLLAAKQEGNATYAGRALFAGTATDVKPYDSRPYAAGPPPVGLDAYGGDGGDVVRSIGPGVAVAVNVRGSEALGDGADGKLLATLRSVAAHLRGGTPADSTALRSVDLKALDANIDALLTLRARVGATANRLEAADARLAELEESSSMLLSETEDADMAKTLVAFSTQQAVYQSALKSGANIVQSSLLDFLR